jgi:hypothetical protein
MSRHNPHIKIDVPVPWSDRPLEVSLYSATAVIATVGWLVYVVVIVTHLAR